MIRNLVRSQFLKNVTTLAMGTIISQAIVILSTPILSRIFTIESFGSLAVFSSVATLFAVLSTGRYELAIGLPENDNKAIAIVKLIFKIGFVVSVFYLLIIVIIKEILNYTDSAGFLAIPVVYFAPLYILLIAVYSALGYWKQRQKAYKHIAIANAIQVVTTTLSSVLFGFIGVETGMILALIFGIFSSISFIIATEPDIIYKLVKSRGTKTMAIQYSSFPKYMTFSDLAGTASQQFTPILIATLYSTNIVGLFSMANRMLRLPNIIITSSIANVFRNDAIDEIRIQGNCYKLYISTLKKLVVIAFPIYFVIFMLSPWLFSVFFGQAWYEAGVFARILSGFLFFEFVASPFNTLFTVRGKQNIYMRLQVVNLLLGSFMIFIGYKIFDSVYFSLIIFAIYSGIYNVVMLVLSLRLSRINE